MIDRLGHSFCQASLHGFWVGGGVGCSQHKTCGSVVWPPSKTTNSVVLRAGGEGREEKGKGGRGGRAGREMGHKTLEYGGGLQYAWFHPGRKQAARVHGEGH